MSSTELKVVSRYKYWDVVEEIPQGWVVCNDAGSPMPKSVFITNGKSPLNGQKRAILKLKL